jgi:DnaK suppressor protein
LTNLDTQSVRTRLEERLQEIERTRERMRREGENMTESELSSIDQHPADSGTEMHEQELDQTTEVLLEDEEKRIGEALEAIANGTYGRCIECGKEIPAARLEARPDAIRCVEHQSEYEGSLRMRGGPSAG